ncbi:hypothetical protein PUN28_017337 [Cardiocondyla obscurior]|uniref:Uncharacterized protein n=1 Tax=Cardiocondyla obscurior TaxID=286306 RepID=A0AAW2ENP9_9HYME
MPKYEGWLPGSNYSPRALEKARARKDDFTSHLRGGAGPGGILHRRSRFTAINHTGGRKGGTQADKKEGNESANWFAWRIRQPSDRCVGQNITVD